MNKPSNEPVPVVDPELLERTRKQWLSGDWQSLAELCLKTFQYHPERAQLALFAAVGQLLSGKIAQAKSLLHLARDWGAGSQITSEILIASLHGTLGRMYVIQDLEDKAYDHFDAALAIAHIDEDRALLAKTRVMRESINLGLLPQAAKLMSAQLMAAKNQSDPQMLEARLKILEAEVGLLHHELSLAQQRQQIYGSQADQYMAHAVGSKSWKDQLKQKTVSQLGQDLWVLEQTDYKNGGFFVEFGATDGVLLSNTWLLEKEFGWKGICAEPNPRFFEQLEKNRNCIVSNQYIGRASGEEVEFILADVFGASKEFAAEDMHMDKRNAYAEAGHITKFISISLDDFLEQHGAPREIDYVSIDTEGSEYSILQDFPFEKWRIRFFSIEHNYTEQRLKIRELMSKNGYSHKEAEWDDWYFILN